MKDLFNEWRFATLEERSNYIRCDPTFRLVEASQMILAVDLVYRHAIFVRICLANIRLPKKLAFRE